MKIDQLVLGDYETNCYCLRGSDADKDCLLIDTGLQAEELLDFLAENSLSPKMVIFTHGHADHIGGATLLRKNYPDIQVAIHKDDADMLTSSVRNGSVLSDRPFTTAPSDLLIEEDGPAEFAGFELEVLHTPGHTPGGICLYSKKDKLVFVGDTLFANSVGRTDLPGGDSNQLINSIRQKLLTLPDDTKVYCGHGPATTIQVERQTNPFLTGVC